MNEKAFLETIMFADILILRKLVKEFQEGLKQPFCIEKEFRLLKIQRAIKKILRVQNNWPSKQNNIYLKVFPHVSKAS